MSDEPQLIGFLAMGLTGQEEIRAAHSVHFAGGPLHGTTEVRDGREPRPAIAVDGTLYRLIEDEHGPMMTSEGRWLYGHCEAS